jgi:excinuclease ABC subunit A
MPMPRGNLFIFDEPTTGLHFDDVAMLLRLFQRLVDRDHSIVVIEHNLEVIKCADWIVDLGLEAGDAGGEVIAVGTPEQIAKIDGSHYRPILAKCAREISRKTACHPEPRRRRGNLANTARVGEMLRVRSG